MLIYVRQSLGPKERLVHVGRFHWLYTVNACFGIFWGVFSALVILAAAVFVQMKTGFNLGPPFAVNDSWFSMVMKLHPGIKIIALMFFVIGLIKFAHQMIIRATTEIAVTSNRVIYKRGLIARYVGEISIDRIEGVNVIQTMPGRIFDFGNIIIRGMGVGEVILPPIINPLKFRRAIEYARNV